MPDRVEVVETTWKIRLPDEAAQRRLLHLLFTPQAADERDDAGRGEADSGEGQAA